MCDQSIRWSFVDVRARAVERARRRLGIDRQRREKRARAPLGDDAVGPTPPKTATRGARCALAACTTTLSLSRSLNSHDNTHQPYRSRTRTRTRPRPRPRIKQASKQASPQACLAGALGAGGAGTPLAPPTAPSRSRSSTSSRPSTATRSSCRRRRWTGSVSGGRLSVLLLSREADDATASPPARARLRVLISSAQSLLTST